MSRAVCIGGAPRFCADFIIGFLNFYPLLFRSIRFFSVACKTPAVKILIRYPLSVIKKSPLPQGIGRGCFFDIFFLPTGFIDSDVLFFIVFPHEKFNEFRAVFLFGRLFVLRHIDGRFGLEIPLRILLRIAVHAVIRAVSRHIRIVCGICLIRGRGGILRRVISPILRKILRVCLRLRRAVKSALRPGKILICAVIRRGSGRNGRLRLRSALLRSLCGLLALRGVAERPIDFIGKRGSPLCRIRKPSVPPGAKKF